MADTTATPILRLAYTPTPTSSAPLSAIDLPAPGAILTQRQADAILARYLPDCADHAEMLQVAVKLLTYGPCALMAQIITAADLLSVTDGLARWQNDLHSLAGIVGLAHQRAQATLTLQSAGGAA